MMKRFVATFVLMVASTIASVSYGQTLVAPDEMSEVDSTVEVVVQAEPGSEWFIVVGSERVASMQLDETGVAKQSIWLGAITEPMWIRVEEIDGPNAFERRLVPRGWTSGDVAPPEPERAQTNVATSTVYESQPSNSPLKLGIWTVASTFLGYLGGYVVVQPVVQPLGFRDGRPTVSGNDRLVVQYLVSGSILLGVGATNFVSSYFFLEGDPLLPAGIPLLGVAALVVLGYAAPNSSDETIDLTSLGIAYGGAALSALALWATSPGSYGSRPLLQVGVFPTRDGATLSVGGEF